MGTKRNPGKFDCYHEAHPDEPMFVLLGRDPVAWLLVQLWVRIRQAVGWGEPAKMAEALECSKAMRAWAIKVDGEAVVEKATAEWNRVLDNPTSFAVEEHERLTKVLADEDRMRAHWAEQAQEMKSAIGRLSTAIGFKLEAKPSLNEMMQHARKAGPAPQRWIRVNLVVFGEEKGDRYTGPVDIWATTREEAMDIVVHNKLTTRECIETNPFARVGVPSLDEVLAETVATTLEDLFTDLAEEVEAHKAGDRGGFTISAPLAHDTDDSVVSVIVAHAGLYLKKNLPPGNWMWRIRFNAGREELCAEIEP